jgi:uncharacterized RDD family membrane protein YckC
MGAAAPDPARLTPPSRGPAPLRDVPGLRKREKVQPAWKDEVRERMRQRKRKGGAPEAELPLFREENPAVAPIEAPTAEPTPEPAAAENEPAPLSDAASEFQPDVPPTLFEEPEPAAAVPELRPPPPRPRLPELSLKPLDLPTRTADDSWDQAPADAPDAAAEDEPDPPPAAPPTPLGALESVERPAHFGERLQAGAVDAAILAGLYAVVLYFASRAAHTSVSGLAVAWPWLAAYLAFLGLVYAAWFTGMRGQTPGKMMFGLLVLTQAGERPGWLAAVARAAAGAAGIALAGLGMLPLFFDPARRALHDRLLRARVVKV